MSTNTSSIMANIKAVDHNQKTVKKSRYMYGIITLFLGCFGGSSAYLGGRMLLSTVLALLTPFYFKFIPWMYLRWVLLAFVAVNLIRATFAYANMGYVANASSEFLKAGEENTSLRYILLSALIIVAVAWCVAAYYMVGASF
ncbi:hypothetical protein KPC83_01275 [Collinsella sp. zg1085]|uniref:hypothetical protein n=1 Tax=Collinsella sp. zg1085 TaxID=2844380 RepID=UPI001C0CDAF4|nr:hypothetical protein [Collinsella sp. zg1085]QWT17820.1 hypothetical protein KPC83_01275 [Collinsella sp. zg1085]